MGLFSAAKKEYQIGVDFLLDGVADESAFDAVLLELQFVVDHLDILRYMQTLEARDWKLRRDEIEIHRNDYLETTLKMAISTLSTRKERVRT